MSNIMKHVGKVGEKPCVVVFREIPGEPEHCLVVETGTLQPDHHDTLMEVVQSAEGQESNDISQVLNRRTFRDGANILQSLHFGKKLLKRPVDQVTMTPVPNSSIPLRDLNSELKKITEGWTPPKTDPSHLQQRDGAVMESDPTLNAQRIDEAAQQSDHAGSPEDQARNILMQAELMEQDAKSMAAEAKAKRAEAYKLDPSLKPQRKTQTKKKASGE